MKNEIEIETPETPSLDGAKDSARAIELLRAKITSLHKQLSRAGKLANELRIERDAAERTVRNLQLEIERLQRQIAELKSRGK